VHSRSGGSKGPPEVLSAQGAPETLRFAQSELDPTYRDIYLEKDEPVIVQPTLEDLLRPEAEEEDALSLADFDDEQ